MIIGEEATRTWRHAGYQCAIRMYQEYPCGYVQIPKGHPWHGDSELYVDGHEVSFSEGDDSGQWWVGVDWRPMRHHLEAAGLSVAPFEYAASVAEYHRRHGPSMQDVTSAVVGLANRAREVADGQQS